MKAEADVTGRAAIEVAIAVVFDPATGKVLICKRKADAVLAGYWEFPGGKCDAGERPADCAVREVREETGLEVKVVQGLERVEHVYPHGRVRLHPFVCEMAGGVLELKAVADARWIAAEAIGGYRFPEANGGLVERIKGGYGALMKLGKTVD